MKKSLILLIVLVAVVSTLFLNASRAQSGYGIGDAVSDFKLENIDGKMISLSDYKTAKGFVIVFTCNTCPYAKAYESRIIDLHNKFSSKNFPVLAINPNDIIKQPGDSMEEMQKRAKEKKYPFAYLKDDSQEVAKAFGASKTPHVFVVNKDSKGEFIVEFIGAIDDSPNDPTDVSEKFVEDAVYALLNNSKPTIKEKRAIGCTIKWKS